MTEEELSTPSKDGFKNCVERDLSPYAKTEDVQKELKELKAKVNKSMEQLVKLVLKTKRQLQSLEDRIAVYNTRGGHKI